MSKADFPWVKWDYEAFLNGTWGLDPLTVGVYTILLNLIYDRGGPINDDIPWLARRIGMRPTSLEKVLAELVSRGKIIRTDGVIGNERAEKEIKSREKVVEKWRKNFSGGDSKPPEKPNENNAGSKPLGDPPVRPKAGVESKELKESGRVGEGKPPPPGLARQPSARLDPTRAMSDQNLVFARSRGLTTKEAKYSWEKFTRHYRGLPDSHKNAKSPDWDAVWENWAMRDAERLGRDPLVEINGHANGHNGPINFDRNDWIRIVEVWRITANWNPEHGPEPGRPGCLAPADVVTGVDKPKR